MTNYVIRRLLMAAVVVLMAALATYFLLNIAPGGPLAGLQQRQVRMTPEDKARIRAQYELDLYWPVRFSRWLIGEPRGQIIVFGRELFAKTPLGCYLERPEKRVPLPDGRIQLTLAGCDIYVYPADLPQLHPDIKSSKGILRGDFGLSSVITRDRPVSALIASRIGATLLLMGLSTLLSLLFAVPIGIYSAVKQYSRFDYFFTTVSFMGQAMPVFFLGMIMILIFSVLLHDLQQGGLSWLPYLQPGSLSSQRDWTVAAWLPDVTADSFADHLLHLLMPLTVLTLFSMATWSRFVRSSMLEVLRQDYVRTARAKGLVENVVILKHALRNALIPFVTVVVLQIPGLFAGAILTETVFNWPGMGRLYAQALNVSDWPVALALIFITALLTVLATLLGDVLYTVVDPRIRYS